MGFPSQHGKMIRARIRVLNREGKDRKQIAEALNAEGVKTREGSPWTPGSIGSHLRYMGFRIRGSHKKKPEAAKTAKTARGVPVSAHHRNEMNTVVSLLSHNSISAEDRIAMVLLFLGATKK